MRGSRPCASVMRACVAYWRSNRRSSSGLPRSMRAASLAGSSPSPPPIQDEAATGRYRQVAVAVRLRCGNAETLAVLHALESARPYLFVDALGITAQRYIAIPGNALPQEGGLDVSFNLYGYLRPAVAAGEGEVPRG